MYLRALSPDFPVDVSVAMQPTSTEKSGESTSKAKLPNDSCSEQEPETTGPNKSTPHDIDLGKTAKRRTHHSSRKPVGVDSIDSDHLSDTLLPQGTEPTSRDS